MFGVHQWLWNFLENFMFQTAQLGDLVMEMAEMFPAVDAFRNEFMLIALLIYCAYNVGLIYIFARAVIGFWNLLVNRR